jgi:hypothetical protein
VEGVRATTPPGPFGSCRRPFQEGLDALADALVVMVGGEDEAGSAARPCRTAAGRQRLFGEV